MDLFKLVGTIAINATDALNAIDSTTQKSANLGNKMQTMGAAVSNVGTKMMPVTLAIGGIATASVKTAADFENSMSKVKAISGATGSDFEKLTAKAREMGSKTKFSASEAADAMNYMAMAGWETEDMLSGIDGVMNLAAASGEDLATTSDIVTDALTAFGKSSKDAGTLADIMAAASSNANTNVSMMGETFKYCAPVAGALGYSMEDTAVAIGLMANAGVKGTQAGTSLRSMFTRLAAPPAEAAKAMDKLGISITNADGTMKPLNQVIGEMQEAFNGLSEAEQAEYAKAIAGQEAMSGFLAIVNAAPSDINKLTDAVYNSNGAAEEMAATMQDNLNGQLTFLKSALQEAAISIGNALVPSIKKAVEYIQKWTDKFNSLDEEQQQAIIKIAGVVAALAPLLIILGKLLTAISSIINYVKLVGPAFKGLTTIVPKVTSAFSSLGSVFSSIGSTISSGLSSAWTALSGFGASIGSFLTADIGALLSSGSIATIGATIGTALIGGIVAAIAGFNLGKWLGEKISEAIGDAEGAAAYRDFHWFGEGGFFPTVGEEIGYFVDEQIKPAFEKIKNAVSIILQGISLAGTIAFDALKGAIVSRVEEIQNKVTSVFAGIQTTITTVSSAISAFVTTTWNAIKGTISTVVSSIQQVVTNAWNAIKNTVTNVTNAIKQNVTNAWNAIKNTVTTVLNAIKSTATTVFGAIKTTITTAMSTIKSAISSGFEAAKNSVTNSVNAIKNTVTNVFNTVVETVKNAIAKVKEALSEKLSLNIGSNISGAVSAVASKVGISKHAKGGVMTKPTFLGYDGENAHIGGEAGAEAIAPISTLQSYVASAVANGSGNTEALLTQMIGQMQALTKTIENMGGDTIAPIYIGSEKLDEIIIKSNQRQNFRSGGVAYV